MHACQESRSGTFALQPGSCLCSTEARYDVDLAAHLWTNVRLLHLQISIHILNSAALVASLGQVTSEILKIAFAVPAALQHGFNSRASATQEQLSAGSERHCNCRKPLECWLYDHGVAPPSIRIPSSADLTQACHEAVGIPILGSIKDGAADRSGHDPHLQWTRIRGTEAERGSVGMEDLGDCSRHYAVWVDLGVDTDVEAFE